MWCSAVATAAESVRRSESGPSVGEPYGLVLFVDCQPGTRHCQPRTWEFGDVRAVKDGEWRLKVRLVARECSWAEHRGHLLSLMATHWSTRVINFMPLKLALETFEADAVNAHHQAPQHKNVIVAPSLDWKQLGMTQTSHGV